MLDAVKQCRLGGRSGPSGARQTERRTYKEIQRKYKKIRKNRKLNALSIKRMWQKSEGACSG